MLPLILPLLALLSAGPARAGQGVGLDLGLAGIHGSARHRLQVQGGLWWAVAPRPWGLVVEAAVGGGRSEAAGLRFTERHARLDAVAGLALGTHATTVHAGLGPAVLLEWDRVTGDQVDASAVRPRPGLRLRAGLGGPLVGRLAWSGHLGGTVHPAGTDLDAALGLGVGW